MIEFCIPEFFPKPLGPYALWVRGTAKNFGLRDVGLTILIQIFGKKKFLPPRCVRENPEFLTYFSKIDPGACTKCNNPKTSQGWRDVTVEAFQHLVCLYALTLVRLPLLVSFYTDL